MATDKTQAADKPVAAPASTLTDAIREALKAQAVALAAADAAFENGLQAVCEGVARILGTKPTHAHWEGVAEQFQKDYATARGCAEKTAQNRWHMVTAALRDKFALEKPAKPSKEAARKAKARADVAAKVDKIIKAHKGNAQSILEEAAKAKGADVVVLAKAAEVAAAKATEEAAKAARGKEAKLRETAAKILGAASGATLERMVSTLQQIVAEQKAAKAA